MTPRLLGAVMLAAAACAQSEEDRLLDEELRYLKARVVSLEELLQASRFSSVEQHKGHQRRLTEGEPTNSLGDIATCLDYMWLLVSGALVMLMQAGFAILEAGSVTSKNSGTVLMKNLVDACVGAVCWYFLGYGIAYGVKDGKFVGGRNLSGGGFLELDESDDIIGTLHFKDWFFQWAFCATAATIVSGGTAERMRFPVYALYSAIMTGVIYPFIVYWTWSGAGWLTIGSGDAGTPDGYSDFAGSGIVHLTGGIGALVGAALLGAREGRWERPDEFKPSSPYLVVLGTFTLWFGWYGFNCGSTLSFSDVGTATQAGLVAMNTTLSAAAGGITVFVLRLRGRSFDMCGMCNGILAGLVAVCAGVGAMEPSYALVTGVLGAIASECGHILVQLLKIDDPLDAFAVHGCGGITGLLVRPLFDWSGVKSTMFGWHCIGILSIAAWTAVLSLLVMVPFKLLGLLRIDAQEEAEGGDIHLSHSPVKPYEMPAECKVSPIKPYAGTPSKPYEVPRTTI